MATHNRRTLVKRFRPIVLCISIAQLAGCGAAPASVPPDPTRVVPATYTFDPLPAKTGDTLTTTEAQETQRKNSIDQQFVLISGGTLEMGAISLDEFKRLAADASLEDTLDLLGVLPPKNSVKKLPSGSFASLSKRPATKRMPKRTASAGRDCSVKRNGETRHSLPGRHTAFR
jgi:hypothetical protein